MWRVISHGSREIERGEATGAMTHAFDGDILGPLMADAERLVERASDHARGLASLANRLQDGSAEARRGGAQWENTTLDRIAEIKREVMALEYSLARHGENFA